MSEISPPYRRIYFDTNVLVRSKWPQLSQTMRTALTTANAFHILNVLLQPVERELEAHWFRDHSRTKTDAVGKVNNLTALCTQIGVTVRFALPAAARLKQAYRASVESNVMEYHLVRTAPKLRDTEELFDMAIRHKKHFAEKGRNFQDTVICLAAVDDLATCSEDVGAFVSRDDIFEQGMLDNLCEPHGVTLKLFKGEEALNDDLRSFLRNQTVQKWIEDEDNAKAAVLENLTTLQSFISANLEVPTRMGFLASNRILLVKQIDIVGVPRVETPYPLDRTPGEPVVITAKMELDIHVKLRQWSSASSSPESLKAGQVPGPADTSARRALLTEEKEETLRRAVSVEMRCVFRGGRYVDLEPMSVTFVSLASAEPSTMPPAFGRIGSPILGSRK